MGMMSEDEQLRLRIIKDVLAKLEEDPEQMMNYEVLQGGVSGSHTYLVNLASKDVVLKATMPDAESYVIQRAQRETAFYQHLANDIPLRVPGALSII